jgi:alpha-1,3-rhamnosyl/mannosyltransferase
VVWLQAIEATEIVTLLQCAAALIQPSLYEGFGLPVLEAMACGCPVVASEIAPFREITHGAALLVSPNDSTKLAAALREVISSPDLRASLRERGLAQAKKFSWDLCARETLEVYHEAATTR